MKIFICSSIIVLVLLLGGCTGQKPESHIEEKSATQETVVATEFQTVKDVEPVKENGESAATDAHKEVAWLTYAEKYETEHLFSDLYIPAKCWLIENENIMEIISLGDVDNVTVIKQSSVERVEHSTVMDFSNITVFDKTGKSISIMLSQEETDKLLELIDKD